MNDVQMSREDALKIQEDYAVAGKEDTIRHSRHLCRPLHWSPMGLDNEFTTKNQHNLIQLTSGSNRRSHISMYASKPDVLRRKKYPYRLMIHARSPREENMAYSLRPIDGNAKNSGPSLPLDNRILSIFPSRYK